MSGVTAYGNPTAADAARFLAQATFGPTDASIARLQAIGYGAWLDEQFAMPAVDTFGPALALGLTRTKPPLAIDVLDCWWKTAVLGADELRRRVVFSLSQIFVVSFVSVLDTKVMLVASYLDMLGREGFGTYRSLLGAVARHPAMGAYLSHLGNQKPDPATGREPDQNFAREIMQLFSIGLYELEQDGSLRLDAQGDPIETYGQDDIVGLSHVFTGLSWAGPDRSDARFAASLIKMNGRAPTLSTPMQGYPQFHSTEQKRFLGVTIPAGSSDPDADLEVAVATLAAHPNVGPFIGRQLIQRMVTSNPSPGYVGRVAAAFAAGRFASGTWSTGSGARGDLQATIAAVLLDPEARSRPAPGDTTGGRVREPVLRVAHWMRSFSARPARRWRMARTQAQLGQTPLFSPSVFNFYRPGYVPPGTPIAEAAMVAPELQIAEESTVAAYGVTMQRVVRSGIGVDAVRSAYAAEIPLADRPDLLIERLDILLTGGMLRAETKARIRTAVESVPLPATGQRSARLNRVWIAVLFVMVSPDYLVQK